MKRKSALSLLLSLSLMLSLAAPGVAAFAENNSADNSTGSGMNLSKTATANEDGSYTITLEAYATGSKVISTVSKDIPTDIVLVLDQSGSMANCITCGKEIRNQNQTHTSYTAVDTVDTSKTYYVKNGQSYTEVYYCDGSHSFMGRNFPCSGGPGWYTSNQSYSHTSQNKITPKTSDDQNGTQFYSSISETCTPRLNALKTAAESFVRAVKEKANGKDGTLGTEDDIDHRIAVVGFASGSGYGDNTELLSISGRNSGSVGVAYNSISDQNLKDVMQDMSTDQGPKMVNDALSALAANGATRTDLGMDMAKRILDANPVPQGETRNRVVIVFTDGSPTDFNGFQLNVANSAISKANEIKGAGATVYSIGIFSGADATSAGTEPSGNLDQNNSGIPAASNWFMQKLSNNNGTPQTPSYYLSAGDAASLNSIFQQISDQITSGGSDTTLGSETVIKDIVSPSFTLPEGAAASNITLKTYECTGKTDDGYTWSSTDSGKGDASAAVNGNQVSVTGFDFSANWCGTETDAQGNVTARGKKLVISFEVEPKEGFLGGNNVYTNTNAGVYKDSDATEPVMIFDRPQVNVPIQGVTVSAEDKNVYLLGNVTADQLKNGTEVKVGNVALDLSKADQNYGLESWQTEYVDISVSLMDKDGRQIPASGLQDLRNDETYTTEVTVKPKAAQTGAGADGTPNSMEGVTNSAAKNLNVFKPELTFKDSMAYYGDTAPTDFSTNKTGEVWKHGDTDSSSVTMIGQKPTLDITYTPESGKIENGKINTKQDIGVDAAVKIGTADVTNYTHFVHTDCEGKTCTLPVGKEFLIHVNTCTLTVTKKGGNADEPYVFTVLKDGKKYSEVTVMGNNSATICELPVGTYTIEEDEGWSWRFTPQIGKGVTLSSQKTSGEITCTNTKAEDSWLNGFSQVVTNTFGVSNNAAH